MPHPTESPRAAQPPIQRHAARRTAAIVSTLSAGALLLTSAVISPSQAEAADGFAAPSTEPVGGLPLLSDPFLQVPEKDSVNVVWATEFAGAEHAVLVGEAVGTLTADQLDEAAAGKVAGVAVFDADTSKFSRLVEDAGSNIPAAEKPAAGVAERDVWRHEAKVSGLTHGERVPYRVVSFGDGGTGFAGSGTFSLSPAPQAGDDQRILITSDHQAMSNTAANLQMASKTFGDIDAVFLAGDLVNQPDRASEWFDDSRGGAFFPVLQGNASRASTHGEAYTGAEILQNAPIYTAIGNHEVQGRVADSTSISDSFNYPVPTEVAAAEYEKVAATVNPTGDPAVKAAWIEDNSFSSTTYEEMFSLPESATGDERYYAVTVGDVRLISLYSTRIWRADPNTADPAARTAISRYQETPAVLGAPLKQGHGEFIFEPIDDGSEQLAWLEGELKSKEFTDARFRVVMMHEGVQTMGGNVMPHFTDPVRTVETDANGATTGIRYEYPADQNHLINDVGPLLEEAGVDLVQQAHNHIWNRFKSENDVNYLETSNTGNTYRVFHPLSGNSRPIPKAPWIASNYLAQGNPGGLEPIMPTGAAPTNAAGVKTPFVQSNDHAVFTLLDTGSNEVISYIYDVRTPEVAPVELDRFSLGRAAPVPTPEPTAPPAPGPAPTTTPAPVPTTAPTAPDADAATVVLSADSVVAGGTVSITGTGFGADESVSATLNSVPRGLGSKQAINGTVRMTVTIPADAEPGAHRIELRGATTAISASAALRVTSPAGTANRGDGTLANTGVDAPAVATTIAASLGALLLGAGALLWRRTRRSNAG
jgi:hypothetical protein